MKVSTLFCQHQGTPSCLKSSLLGAWVFHQFFQPLNNIVQCIALLEILKSPQCTVQPVLPNSRYLAVAKCPLQKIHNYPGIRHPRDMSKPWRSVCTNKSFNQVDPCGLIPLVRVSTWGGETHPNNGAASWWYSRLHFLEAIPIVRTAALHIRIFLLVWILHFFQILLSSWLKKTW